MLRWLLPASVLALMPKCPMCFAGYIALGTGLGVSAPLAGQLRGWAIAACLVWLGGLLVWRMPSVLQAIDIARRK